VIHGSRRPAPWVMLAGLALLASSCAYYNTYYFAKRYYTTATSGLPYAVEKPNGSQTGNYQKAIDYSKKVIASYPKSKWVDDAYLLWAQSLLGKEDPLQSINMLLDFPVRFPNSPRANDATFYLGVAYRQARKPREALISLDEFLQKAPKSDLAPYAHLERALALASLERPAEASQAAGQIIDHYPASPLVPRALATQAEALLAGGDPVAARNDFQRLGSMATDDDQRFQFMLREADCLEAARDYTGSLSLLSSALSQEVVPIKGPNSAAPTGPGADRYGQITLRIGTAHLLEGRSDDALAAYRRVIQDYPRTGLSAEAQYRIGYTYETALDDFTTARQEYAKVRDQSVGSAFFTQATDRQASLDRLERFRSAGADSVDRQVEAGFLLAEQYLFQLDKPERALEAYAAIATEHAGTPAAGKALNAQAWVLRRKLNRPVEADSLWWKVVHEYPATEAQLAARDYLEASGTMVPVALIQGPEVPEAPADSDTTIQLTRPPEGPLAIGPTAPGGVQLGDSLSHGPQALRMDPVPLTGTGAAGSAPAAAGAAAGAVAGGAAAVPSPGGTPQVGGSAAPSGATSGATSGPAQAAPGTIAPPAVPVAGAVAAPGLVPARSDSTAAPARSDSTAAHAPARSDTTAVRAPADTTRARPLPPPQPAHPDTTWAPR
jgi:tetratricopeptide (TPR) repeat protein